MTKLQEAHFNHLDPFVSLSVALLNRAKEDAKRGDLAALAWLVADGAALAGKLAVGADDLVLDFARDVLEKVGAGKVAASWGVGYAKTLFDL